MLFVRRQFEMHKRNSHIIWGTLNSTVTRVPSPFPHPVASVYLFLSLSPSFCLSVCPYFPLSVDHLSGQPRNFGHFGVRLHSNWKHMSNGWLISSFNLHSPTSLLPLTHTHTRCVYGRHFRKTLTGVRPILLWGRKKLFELLFKRFSAAAAPKSLFNFSWRTPLPRFTSFTQSQRKQKANRGRGGGGGMR